MIDWKYLRNEAESTCRYSSPYMSRKELGELLDMLEAAKLDAARYQWLRERSWFDSEFCVVRDPRRAVMPGHDCPSHERLDVAIDSAMAATKGEQA